MNAEIIQFLLAHGYMIMFMLMVIEGPVITLATAFLASLGYFSLPAVFALSILGDLVGDVLWYSIGRQWGRGFVRRYGRYVGISLDLLVRVEKFFAQYGAKAIVGAKSTTGLCLVTFIVAGMARMPLQPFVLYALIGGIVWSAILVGLGYFFGALYEQIAVYIAGAGWLIAALAVIAIMIINTYKKQRGKKFL